MGCRDFVERCQAWLLFMFEYVSRSIVLGAVEKCPYSLLWVLDSAENYAVRWHGRMPMKPLYECRSSPVGWRQCTCSTVPSELLPLWNEWDSVGLCVVGEGVENALMVQKGRAWGSTSMLRQSATRSVFYKCDLGPHSRFWWGKSHMQGKEANVHTE